jgi:predicted membrane protein
MELIDITRNSLIVLHFVGLASLLGGFLTQMRAMRQATAKVVPAMVHGVWTSFVTGLLLVGVAEWRIAMGATFTIDHTKIAVKTVVALVILVLVMTQRKKESVKAPIFGSIGALTLTNVVLAVFW